MGDRTNRILLIEDDLMIQDLLSCLLETAGYDVEVARDGVSALEALADQAFGMVLTDRHLRGETGADVLRRFLATAPLVRPIFVAVTGDVAGLRDNHAEVALFDAILAKPVDLDGLLTTVRTLAATTAPQ